MTDKHIETGADHSVGGRPTKLTPEVQEKFLQAIRAGNHREVAAAYAGFSPATLYRWLRNPDEPFRSFRGALEAAEASVEVDLVASITEEVRKDPKRGLEFLSRRYPERWAPVTTPASGDRGARSRRIDREVEAGYERLTAMTRWTRTLVAAASDNGEEVRRLRDTCPPEDIERIRLVERNAQLVVTSAALAWFRALVPLAARTAVIAGRMLGYEMYELGLRDSQSERRPGQGYQSRFLFRVVTGPAFAGPKTTDVPGAERRLRSVWQGICEFSARVGIPDVEMLLALLPGLFEEIEEELAMLSGEETDDDLVREVADNLWDLWNLWEAA